MTKPTSDDHLAEEIWHDYLTHGISIHEQRQRRLFKILPGSPRCRLCYVPFGGAGGRVARVVYNKRPSNLNPHLCNGCEVFAREHPGGAEVELSLLFADVRGSTTLAETLGTAAFSQLISRFYQVVTRIMGDANALIDKIIGDQAAGVFTPGLAGPDHARQAVETARLLLAATGHSDPGGPWIPLGVGVHTGTAYFGTVGSAESAIDITVLGDAPNTAARLSSQARVGEILISEPAYQHAGLELGELEMRQLELKGKAQSVGVRVLKG